MKFSFEKAKNVSKKVAIGAGIVTAGILPLKSNGIEKVDNGLKNKNNIEFKDSKENNVIKPSDSIHLFVAQNSLENKQLKLSEENTKLIESIKKLEGKFKELSKGETEIYNGSLSIISEKYLNNENKNDFNNPILDNRYITEVCENIVFNKNNNLKLMSKDFMVIKDSQLLHDEGWVNLKNNGYTKHLIPEYYFIITQDKKGEGTIEFKLKIIYSKIEKVEEIVLPEKLPDGNAEEIKEFVDSKIIPDLSNLINNKIEELGLNL